MMSAEERAPGPDLVPELLVTNLKDSMEFWCGLCGFEVAYDRLEEGFAYLASGTAHLMIEQAGVGRNWTTAPLQRPYGRGVNFQISVAAIQPLVTAFRAAGRHLFMEPETKWYRTGNVEVGVVQFLVQDPDGYLVRFQQSLGSR